MTIAVKFYLKFRYLLNFTSDYGRAFGPFNVKTIARNMGVRRELNVTVINVFPKLFNVALV